MRVFDTTWLHFLFGLLVLFLPLLGGPGSPSPWPSPPAADGGNFQKWVGEPGKRCWVGAHVMTRPPPLILLLNCAFTCSVPPLLQFQHHHNCHRYHHSILAIIIFFSKSNVYKTHHTIFVISLFFFSSWSSQAATWQGIPSTVLNCAFTCGSALGGWDLCYHLIYYPNSDGPS